MRYYLVTFKQACMNKMFIGYLLILTGFISCTRFGGPWADLYLEHPDKGFVSTVPAERKDDNLITGNDVVDNDLAVQLNGGCDGNRFVRNNFINNLSDLLLDVSDLETKWADVKGGNYWSSYRGYDLDGDGAGDLPFPIQNVFQILETKVPEVRFYLLSPAAEVLKAAERALPILRLGDAEDPLPAMFPINNREVPWEKSTAPSGSGSAVLAMIFLVGTALPVAGLWRLGQPGRRDSRRKSGRIG